MIELRNSKLLPMCVGLLMVSGCGNPTPEKAAVAPVKPIAAPLQSSTSVARAPKSVGLTKIAGNPGFSLDVIGKASDPINKPAVISVGGPVVFTGFGFDSQVQQVAKGVDLVLDGKPYASEYGSRRQDVADYFKAPQLEMTGFSITIPAELISPGEHTVIVRVVSNNGESYRDSPEIKFVAK